MESINAIIVTTMDDKNPVSIWDSSTGTLIAHYRGGGSIPHHCISVGKDHLYASEKGKPLIHSWPFNKQHCSSRRLVAPGKIGCFDFSPDTVHMAVAVGEKLHLYQLTSGRQLGMVSKHYQPISIVKFNTTGTLIACGGQDGMITVWTLASIIQKTDPVFSSMDHNLPIGDLAFTSGNLRSRIISVSADFSCKIFEVNTSQQLLSIAFPARPTSLALTPNETTIFIGNSEGGIFEVGLLEKSRKMAEYHQTTDDSNSTFGGHEKQVSCLACSKDSQFLISGSYDETVRIWHIESHQCVRKIPQKAVVTNLIFNVFSAFNFTVDFKATSVVNSFVNPSNEDNDNVGFELLIPDDRHCNDLPINVAIHGRRAIQEKVPLTAPTGDQEAHLKLEIEKLKTINNQMYNFAVKAILNGPSGVAYDGIVPHRNVKLEKAHMKKKSLSEPNKKQSAKETKKLKNKARKNRKRVSKKKMLETNGNNFEVEVVKK